MFKIGDRVNRIESVEVRGATVTEIDGDNLGLNYDEREEPDITHGWWPVTAVEAG